jgi:uncharacterized protein
MRIDQDKNPTAYQIKKVEPGAIQVNETWYQQSIIVDAHELTLWPPRHPSELESAHFDVILQRQPRILLLGTGEKLIFPEQKLMRLLASYQIGVEVMNTVAACRTFEALMSEQRDAVAALIIPEEAS